jgi:CDGSH-type Zn-finger protein
MDIKKIRILTNGPYVVSGHIPLSEKVIVPKGRGYKWKEGRKLPQAGGYALCRCGKTKKAPFCDGIHTRTGFRGIETAAERPFEYRCDVIEGPDLDILDDHRCAFARFCHREQGTAWELTRRSGDPVLKAEAIEAARECPAGRLVARQKTGETLEPAYEPSIVVIQDPEEGVSGGLWVRGNIPIESADGQIYERRVQVVLCRCGHSRNMPFCDAAHVAVGYVAEDDEIKPQGR